jgi:hypothetical protein
VGATIRVRLSSEALYHKGPLADKQTVLHQKTLFKAITSKTVFQRDPSLDGQGSEESATPQEPSVLMLL